MGVAPGNPLFPPPVGRVPVYRSAAVSSMEAGESIGTEFEADFRSVGPGA